MHEKQSSFILLEVTKQPVDETMLTAVNNSAENGIWLNLISATIGCLDLSPRKLMASVFNVRL